MSHTTNITKSKQNKSSKQLDSQTKQIQTNRQFLPDITSTNTSNKTTKISTNKLVPDERPDNLDIDARLNLKTTATTNLTDSATTNLTDSATTSDSVIMTNLTNSVAGNSDSWDDLLSQLNNSVVQDTTHVYQDDRRENTDAIANKYKNLEATVTTVETCKDSACPSCGGLLRISDGVFVCTKCGLEIKQTALSSDDSNTVSVNNNSVNAKGFISMRFIGKKSYGYNRNLLKSCSNYSQYRKNNTLKEMHNWNAQSVNMKLPKNVMDEANNMFAKIKENGYVYRKDVKKGVQSACLYYACYNNGISKTPNEIAQIVQIAEKFHSAGDRILRDLNERGVIELPSKINPIMDYTERYFELLNIPKKYKEFVIDIIKQADVDKLHVLCDSKNNTKCIGAIYMLIDRVKELRDTIDKDRIDKECEISKTTFVKYYTLLCKFYRRFVHIFVKHRIPMKSEWRENIADVINGIEEPKKKEHRKNNKAAKQQIMHKPMIRKFKCRGEPVLTKSIITKPVISKPTVNTTKPVLSKPTVNMIKSIITKPTANTTKLLTSKLQNNANACIVANTNANTILTTNISDMTEDCDKTSKLKNIVGYSKLLCSRDKIHDGRDRIHGSRDKIQNSNTRGVTISKPISKQQLLDKMNASMKKIST
jgi:transcription initiation factor TFIIIB Brf1 subunit/transcription initiation factor TFIIB